MARHNEHKGIHSFRPRTREDAPALMADYKAAATDWHTITGHRYPKEWTNDQIMWAEFRNEPFNAGTIPGIIVGGWVPQLMMACFGPYIYGDAYAAAYLNRPPGIEEENNRLAGVQLAEPDYVNSDASMTNMISRMPGMRLG